MATATSTIHPSPIIDDTAERRRHHRLRFEADAMLFSENTPDAAGQPVRVFDISLAGVGFRSKRPLPLCTLHSIEIASPTIHLNSRLRITRCDRRTTGYDVGGEFVER